MLKRHNSSIFTLSLGYLFHICLKNYILKLPSPQHAPSFSLPCYDNHSHVVGNQNFHTYFYSINTYASICKYYIEIFKPYYTCYSVIYYFHTILSLKSTHINTCSFRFRDQQFFFSVLERSYILIYVTIQSLSQLTLIQKQ